MVWIPLQFHSQYSILDAVASIPNIVKKAKEYDLPAIALTDHGNLFGAVEFYKACTKENIKPIIGCELYLAPHDHLAKSREPGQRVAYPMVFLAKNDVGYHNLVKLSSIGYVDGFYYFPRVDKKLIEKHSEGLICISGYLGTSIADAILEKGNLDLEQELLWHKNLFKDDFYLSLQRHQMSGDQIDQDGYHKESWLFQKYQSSIEEQAKINGALINLGQKHNVKCVASNDSHYIEREDWRAHEVLMNVQSGEPCEVWEKDSLGNLKQKIPNPKRKTYFSHEFYFKSPAEMAKLFEDIPEALENCLEVSEKCNYHVDFETKHYPVYVPPDLKEGYSEQQRVLAAEEYLKKLCYDNIPIRYDKPKLDKIIELYPNQDPLEVIRSRLEMELETIISKGMCDYLLIVYDFIHWAKQNKIPVGPGRGSGAGSIILYLISITDIEPLRFFLFFERFINPERLSYPDIDVDICMEKRGEVIDYTLQKYGKENVAQIITFGTMKAKMAIKDVGRVLSVPLSKVNQIAKLIPEELGITIDKALQVDPDLASQYQNDDETKKVIDLAKILEGCVRNTGVHAAGVVISGEPLVEHIPICLSKDSELAVTQFSMKPLEAVGMLKMDFLGLKTLTCIQKAVDLVKLTSNTIIDWTNLPLDDKPTFDLLNHGKTLGVFQLESAGMADLAQKLHIDKFEEIIAAIALYRPGPMSMIPSFINRKHKKEKSEIDHAWMEDILKETYGVMVYQEQVMQIAQKLANYSLGEGDVLRRAMGKKDAVQMATQREKFKAGAYANQISEEVATKIFDQMEKFAAYGFNKSHAAAYAYLSYVTAYLKANYTKEWMAALMTCDSDDTTKVAKFIQECKALNIEILPPSVNEVSNDFMPSGNGIRFAMGAIKGVGQGVVDTIALNRQKSGPFTTLHEFFQRIDLKKVGKKNLENLAKAGCFDYCGWNRDEVEKSIEPMFDSALLDQKEKSQGVISFFSMMSKDDERFNNPPKILEPTSKLKQLFIEKELLGFFLTEHPLKSYQKKLKAICAIGLNKFHDMDNNAIFRTGFIIEDVKIKIAQASQKKFAILIVSDGVERYEMPIWNDLYEKALHLIVENQLICAILRVDEKEGVKRIYCHWIEDLNLDINQLVIGCDQAYDQAKLNLERRQRAKERKKSMPVIEKKLSAFKLKVNLNTVKLSHILNLKKHFRSFPGDTPVELLFHANNKSISKMSIDVSWGIENSLTLKRLIEEIGHGIEILEES